MNRESEENLHLSFGISQDVQEYISTTEASLTDVFSDINAIESYNQAKVLAAFQKERIAAHHFAPSTGYGYGDIGRDALSRVFAHALDAEDALVRPHFVSGTHAIFTALVGLLEHGDTMLSITSAPYDTLENAIGSVNDCHGSLVRQGIRYEQIDLNKNGYMDLDAIAEKLERTQYKVVYMQRSRGYAWRNSISIEEMQKAIKLVKSISPKSIVLADNCYGEFTQRHEPTYIGADVIVGSLIKNPGGGIAPTGGYIVGGKEYIELISHRMTVPGMGIEVGSYAASYRPFFQGLFLAPHTTSEALKTAALFTKTFESVGFETASRSGDAASDIVQAIRFRNKKSLIAFCQSIQRISPVDSFLTPEPWDMPGYTHKVIMASGSFIQGSSIELSADAPIKEPFIAYVQGALTFPHGRLGVMAALQAMVDLGEVKV